jgi:hypothetical protein
MLDVAHACRVVCMVFLFNELVVMVTVVFLGGRMIIEPDDCRNYIHCILMIVRLYKPEFHNIVDYSW